MVLENAFMGIAFLALALVVSGVGTGSFWPWHCISALEALEALEALGALDC